MSVAGGNRPAAAVNPALADRYAKTASAVRTSHGTMSAVQLKPPERHGVKRVDPTDDEKRHVAALRDVGGKQKEMIPEVVGEAWARDKTPYVVMHDAHLGIMGMKIYREAAAEASAAIWSGQTPAPWMVYNEGRPYTPPEQFQEQQKIAAIADAPVAADDELGLFDEDTPAPVETAAAVPAADQSELVQKLQAAVREARKDAANMKEAYELEKEKRQQVFEHTYNTIIDIEGFGEIEGSCDYYAIRGDVLVLGYDNAAKRQIANPRPAPDKSVAQFVMEIMDGTTRHVFELAAPFDSRFTFDAAGASGVTFQQFMILQHKPVTA